MPIKQIILFLLIVGILSKPEGIGGIAFGNPEQSHPTEEAEEPSMSDQFFDPEQQLLCPAYQNKT